MGNASWCTWQPRQTSTFGHHVFQWNSVPCHCHNTLNYLVTGKFCFVFFLTRRFILIKKLESPSTQWCLHAHFPFTYSWWLNLRAFHLYTAQGKTTKKQRLWQRALLDWIFSWVQVGCPFLVCSDLWSGIVMWNGVKLLAPKQGTYFDIDCSHVTFRED